MANEKADGGRIKRITFAVPPEMIFATEALAAAELQRERDMPPRAGRCADVAGLPAG
ncbi:MAG: hypothetical protein WB005_11230 [Pseudolabrys sp.]